MTVAELIDTLREFPGDLTVKVFYSDNFTHRDPELTEDNSWTQPDTFDTIRERILEIR